MYLINRILTVTEQDFICNTFSYFLLELYYDVTATNDTKKISNFENSLSNWFMEFMNYIASVAGNDEFNSQVVVLSFYKVGRLI